MYMKKKYITECQARSSCPAGHKPAENLLRRALPKNGEYETLARIKIFFWHPNFLFFIVDF